MPTVAVHRRHAVAVAVAVARARKVAVHAAAKKKEPADGHMKPPSDGKAPAYDSDSSRSPSPEGKRGGRRGGGGGGGGKKKKKQQAAAAKKEGLAEEKKPSADSGKPAPVMQSGQKSKEQRKAERKAKMAAKVDAKLDAASAPLSRDAQPGGKHAAGSTPEQMIQHAKDSKHNVNGQWQGDGLNQAIARAKESGPIGKDAQMVPLQPGEGVVWHADGRQEPATHAKLMSKKEKNQYVIHGYPVNP